MKKIKWFGILLVVFALLMTGCSSDEEQAQKTIKEFLTKFCTTNYEDVKKDYEEGVLNRGDYYHDFIDEFKQYLTQDVFKKNGEIGRERQILLEQSYKQKISIKVDKITIEKYVSEDDEVVYNYTMNTSYTNPSKDKVEMETDGQLTLKKVDNKWKICFVNQLNIPLKEFAE